ncbi:uncharacterized protein DS421_13g431520 [Arachis hypogaea]|nr:uncharacterized protein DS421_13g431520 [Arachis hypogaea]
MHTLLVEAFVIGPKYEWKEKQRTSSNKQRRTMLVTTQTQHSFFPQSAIMGF